MGLKRIIWGIGTGLLWCLLSVSVASAAIEVSGDITSDTSWTETGDTYLVKDGITIGSGATLTIGADVSIAVENGIIVYTGAFLNIEKNALLNVEDGIIVHADAFLDIKEGVTLQMGNNNSIHVDGTLTASGQPSNKIRFTVNEPGKHWGYIFFSDTSQDYVSGPTESGCRLKHCIVEYGGGADIENSGTIRINNASPIIENCEISNNRSSGIIVFNNGNPAIRGNEIFSNHSESGGGGIKVISNQPVVISNNVIHHNTAGYYRSGSSYRGGGGGINAHGSSDNPVIITNNHIYANTGSGGGGVYCDEAIIDSNVVHDNVAEGKSYPAGGGIGGSASVLTNNLIFGNVTEAEGGGIKADRGSLLNNIIADNLSVSFAKGGGGIYGSFLELVSGNSVVRNTAGKNEWAQDGAFVGGVYLYSPKETVFTGNTVAFNHTVQVTRTGGVYVDFLGWIAQNYAPLINFNNIQQNTGYEIYYYAQADSFYLDAKNNFWGSATENDVRNEIYDVYFDSSLGLIDYKPYSLSPNTDAPILPPQGFSVQKGTEAHSVTLTWVLNPETDVAGYIVYWEKDTVYPYANAQNAGNTDSITLTGLNGTFHFAVTAYDNGYGTGNDNPVTLVDENQTGGHESWFSERVVFKIGPDLDVSDSSHDFGNTTVSGPFPEKQFDITNTGNETMAMGTVTVAGMDASDYRIAADTVSNTTLQPGQGGLVRVEFKPSAPGLKTAQLEIASNDGDLPLAAIVLTGVGDPAGQTGTVVWEYDGFGFNTPTIGANNTIYVDSSEAVPETGARKLYAFNPDGTVKWVFPIEQGTFGPLGEAQTAVGTDGTIYASPIWGARFYALNPDGTEKWVFQPEAWKNGDGCPWSPPAIGNDGTIYFGSRQRGTSWDWEEGKLYALNPDGSLKWETVVKTGSTAPSIAADGTIYIGSGGGSVYALNPDGTERWVYVPQSAYWVASSPAIGANGTVYVGSIGLSGAAMVALDENGTENWRFVTGGRINSSPAIAPDGTIYFGSDDNYFYALNPDGSLKWKFETGGDVVSSPAVGEFGTVYFGSADGSFYALNPHGTLKWSHAAGDGITSSPVIRHDGVIYIGGYNDKLLALTSHSTKPAASSWPMHRHDARRGSNESGLQQFFPFADAGGDQTVDERASVQLDATGSVDPGGSALSFKWVKTQGPDVLLSDDTAAEPLFTAPSVKQSGAALVFELRATNASGWTSTDSVTVSVNDTFVDTEAYDFKSVTTSDASEAFIITIRNSQNHTVTISEISLTDNVNFKADLTQGGSPIGSLPTDLEAGQSATFGVLFVPTTAGIYAESVSIKSTDPDQPTTSIMLHGWGRGDPAGEDFVVTLGEGKTFSACNLSETSGTAESDGQNVLAYVHSDPYENNTSQAFAGVRFDVAEGPGGITVSDATISITIDYSLEVDFDVFPVAEKGGGSADVRLYAWIHNLKEDIAHIAFIHNADYDQQTGTITFTHRLGDAPTDTHLYADKTYEVKAELSTHADVKIGREADTFGSFTVREVKVEFDSPERPQLKSPTDGQTETILAPVLQTEDLSHPSPDATHQKTKWQIAADPDFTLIILDLESGEDLTSFQVPELVLNGGTTYYWRVKFTDNWNIQSVWSEPLSFTTLTPANDTNPANGIPDDQEVGSGTDLDQDGQDDHTQQDIKCVHTVTGDMLIGFKSPNADFQLELLESIPLSAISDTVDKPDEMPMGLIGFRLLITDPNPDGVYELTAYTSLPIPEGGVWHQYDPIDGWKDYSSYTTVAADRMSVTFTLQDGGPGDLDRIRNNIIVDPIGYAYSSSSSQPQPDSTGGGGGGGCFIQAGKDAKGINSADSYGFWLYGILLILCLGAMKKRSTGRK